LAADQLNVIKVNDAVYYATWAEYFNSLVLHNLLFPNTTYSLLGFIESDDRLNVVLSQPFIEGEQAKLDNIKDLLSFNGFENTRRQDYYNKEFGLVLEDMHDENVIAKQGFLFFIDTVFYIMAI
jgi:Serine/Threonine/Tyrosine Kinase found in polyvalent proteins